jgi:hypothetical protein
VTQELKDKPASGNIQLTIAYQVTPDFSLSNRPDDYVNIAPVVNLDGANLGTHPGRVLAFFDVPPISRSTPIGGNVIVINDDKIARVEFTPKIDPKPQTFTAKLFAPPCSHYTTETFGLCFPPGHGTITLTKISVVRASPGQ